MSSETISFLEEFNTAVIIKLDTEECTFRQPMTNEIIDNNSTTLGGSSNLLKSCQLKIIYNCCQQMNPTRTMANHPHQSPYHTGLGYILDGDCKPAPELELSSA
jgi:hypothetical protein